jgi:hypothetical protein
LGEEEQREGFNKIICKMGYVGWVLAQGNLRLKRTWLEIKWVDQGPSWERIFFPAGRAQDRTNKDACILGDFGVR